MADQVKRLKSFRTDICTSGEDIELPLLCQIITVFGHRAQRVAWHTHPGCEFIFVLEGALELEFARHPAKEIRGGQFLVIPAGLRHRAPNDFATPSTRCGLVVEPRCRSARGSLLTRQDLREMCKRLARCELMVRPLGPKLRLMVSRLTEAHCAFQADGHDWLRKLDLRLWCGAVILGAFRDLGLTQETSLNALVTAGEEYLKQHLGEPVHLSDLVRYIGLGRTRLRDLFKSATGLTPHDYLLRLRIRKAQELLAASDVSLTGISTRCGFSSSQHLSSVFHQYVGQTPRQYRRQAHGCTNCQPAA
jgi:AraC-like DNA-binding protein/quercetin dioxygenase-like cupin family protein